MTNIAITKPVVRPVWASLAAAAALVDPDTITASYVANGWPLSSTPPARQFWNWVLNYCMNGVAYFSRRGITDWDSNQTYSTYDVCLATNGVVYQSLQANNTNNTPQTSPAFWGGLNGYALTGVLGGYVTSAQLSAALGSYVTTAALSADLSNYVTNAGLAGTLSTYATQAYVNANGASAVYQSEAYTQAALGPYATAAQVTAVLASYATLSYLQYAYYTSAAVNSLLASYETTTVLDGRFAGYAPLVSPAIQGSPTCGTPGIGSNNGQIANTYYVAAYVNSVFPAYGASPGYIRLNSGVIFQWGSFPAGVNAHSIAFPVTMSSVWFFGAQVSGGNPLPTGTVVNNGASGTVYCASNAVAGNWLVIGI
jgi:hypothetical protein